MCLEFEVCDCIVLTCLVSRFCLTVDPKKNNVIFFYYYPILLMYITGYTVTTAQLLRSDTNYIIAGAPRANLNGSVSRNVLFNIMQLCDWSILKILPETTNQQAFGIFEAFTLTSILAMIKSNFNF